MPHILVIDDDIDLRDIMQEALRAEGYEVSVAADGAQGVALQRKQPASPLADGRIGRDERALLFTCATSLKYPLPPVHRTLDISREIDFTVL